MTRRLLLGVMLGSGAVGAMLVPVQIQAGVFYDLRAPLLIVAGFAGGAPAALLAAGAALLYRLHAGGVGVWAGSAGIIASAAIGVAGNVVTGEHRRAGSHLLLALVATLGLTLTSFILPRAHWMPLQDLLSIGLLNFASTVLFGLSITRDERHRTLMRTNGVYRAIIEALPDSLNVKDRDSRFLAANPATALLMRARSAAELIGKSDAEFYPAAMARGFRSEELKVLAGDRLGPIDQEVEFPDGSRRWLTSLKTPLLDHQGRVQGIITHNRDVTDRKVLEFELLASQRYLNEALAHMADGLVLYDQAGRIRFCNKQYRDLFPRTADLRVEGGRFADIIRAAVLRGEEAPKDDVEAWIAERVAALGRPGERLIELADGRTVEARTRRIGDQDTLVVFSDVTARKQLETDLLRRATRDALTGLPNRSEFEFQLAAIHRRAAAQRVEYAVMMLDLDGFKQVNDTHGHAAGDRLLTEVAGRLQAAVRAGDVVARLGGDEFAFVIAAADVELAATGLANRIVANLGLPLSLGTSIVTPRGSLGLAFYPRDAAGPQALLRLADQALYAVKRNGGGAWCSAAASSERAA